MAMARCVGSRPRIYAARVRVLLRCVADRREYGESTGASSHFCLRRLSKISWSGSNIDSSVGPDGVTRLRRREMKAKTVDEPMLALAER